MTRTDHDKSVDKVQWIFTNNGLTLSPHPDTCIFLHPLSPTLLQLWAPERSPANLPGMKVQCYPCFLNFLFPFPIPHLLCYTFWEISLFIAIQEIPMNHPNNLLPTHPQIIFLCFNKKLMDINDLNMKLILSDSLEGNEILMQMRYLVFLKITPHVQLLLAYTDE